MSRLFWASLALGTGTALFLGCGDETSTPPDLLVDRDDEVLAFENPEECAECHQQHYDEWSISNHAYAVADPVFEAMLKLGQEQTEGKLGQFCVQCHTPVGLASGQTEVVQDEAGIWTQDLSKLDPIAKHGVSCDVCHSITDVVEPVNARAVLTPNGIRRATIEDPVETEAHASEYSPLHASSDLCGMCHSVVNPKGALVEETFPEWASSSFAAEGKQCQDCHMPEYQGKAAKDGPERTLHRHFFVGVDVSLRAPEEFPGYDEMREMTATLLQESAVLGASFDAQSRQLALSIQNLAGHALPSGATAERQMWVQMSIEDLSGGGVVFETGMLDANSDLQIGIEGKTENPGADPQLVYFGQLLISIPGFADLDDAGKAARRAQADTECRSMGAGGVAAESDLVPVDFPWKADWQCNYMIPVDQTATPTYDLSTLPSGSYRANIELKFRTFPPYFLRELEDLAGLDPEVKGRLPIVTMETTTVDFTVP